MILLTKHFDFEMAHALMDYPGKCRNIHGHSYKMEVTVVGETQPDTGMVMDFKHLKDLVNEVIVNKLDHALVLSDATDAALVASLRAHYEKVILVPFQPSAENMLEYFVTLLKPNLPTHVRLYSIRLHETETSYAEWREDQQ
jgi:6-pyruvoyltetrahydropterin/6-carboxytetrahydropterin synthase